MVSVFHKSGRHALCLMLPAAMRIGITLLFLLCLVAPASAQHSKKVEQMKAERTELRKQIEASEQLLHSTKKDVTSQLNNLALLDAQILEKQNYVYRLRMDADSLTRAIVDLQHQLDTLNMELTGCKANYRRAMTFVSRNRVAQSRWMFVLMAEDFRDLYRRMRYAAQYSKYQRVQGEIIQDKEKKVRHKKRQLEDAKYLKVRLLRETRTQQEDLEKKKGERQEMVDRLNKKSKSIQNVIRRDRKKYRDINVRIDRLIKEEIAAAERRRKAEEKKRREAEERRRKAAAARQQKGETSTARPDKQEVRTATPDFSESADIDRKLNSNFAANKGRLPMPITGGYAITSRYGTYDVDGLSGVRLENKGINITGRRGAMARSVFDGEVVIVANFGGSYTVIVRHGEYYSVYNNLANVSVRRRQQVKTGQQLGRVVVNNTGNCVLHFQLRHQTKTLNPQLWIK